MRFAMKRGRWGGPLTAMFGGTRARSYADVAPDAVHFRFGFFGDTVARTNIASANAHPGRVWSLGWRTDFVRRVGLFSATEGVARVIFREPQVMWLLFMPVRVKEIFVSLEDVEGFLKAVRS